MTLFRRGVTARMGKQGRGVKDLLDMMVHLADVNAAESKYRRGRSRWQLKSSVFTPAVKEQMEWAAFKAKLEKRSRLLHAGISELPHTARKYADDGSPIVEVDIDEDDVDMLLSMIGVLERAQASRSTARTISEISRAMQEDKVLSVEFAAAARAQTQRLLNKLREMNRVYQDTHGRWALL